jgi:HAD superfamily hydrolase (TIGR01662 family)
MIKKRKNKQQAKDILIAFDRDGTLIYDDGYFGRKENWKEEIKFYKGAIETIKVLNSFADVIVASNQIGVALGFYGPDRVEQINKYLDDIFKKQGAKIDGWYFCPYVERKWAVKNGLNLKSHWVKQSFPKTRKPQIGMIKLAVTDLNRTINSYKKIFIIGDSLDDIKMALNLANGIGIFFKNRKNSNLIKEARILASANPNRIFFINHLSTAIKIIKNEMKDKKTDYRKDYQIDYHKLMFHPERLASWLKAQNSWQEAKKLYPLYVEISLSGICNHRCRFCAFDYLGYDKGFANFQNLKRAIKDLGKGGVKSVLFSGEGEPLLYPKVKEIIRYTNSLGIDVALATNGTFLTEDILINILPCLKWLRVSLDAGTAETHMKIHQTKTQEFDKIISNLQKAAKIKKKKNLQCVLGGQLILLPDNYKEVKILAKKLKNIGFDYLAIKPYSQHPDSFNREYSGLSYKKYLYPKGINLKDDLEKFNDDNFQVIFRETAMKKLEEKRPYSKCYAIPYFWAHLTTNGDVYSCGNFIGNKKFNLGNYNKKSFKQIWEGDKRKKHWQFMRTKFKTINCRENCRMDEINRYLERLINPPEHVNFI